MLSRPHRQGRRLGLAGALFSGALIAASPAACQSDETTTTTPLPGAPAGTAPLSLDELREAGPLGEKP